MRGFFTAYGLLFLAILAEVFATSSLNASRQFTKIFPAICAVGGYAVSFYAFSHVLKTMPLGIAYALWCALGIVLVSAVGAVFFRQRLDLPACVGLALIIAGVAVIHVFSGTLKH